MIEEQDEQDIEEGEKLTMMIEDRFVNKNSIEYDQKYADKIRVYVKGGKGGNGCWSLYRANFGTIVPNGGDGGDGGSVIFRSTSYISNLYQLRRAHFYGNDGKHGRGKMQNGKAGKDIKFSVPIGTEIYQVVKSNPKEDKIKANEEHKIFITDLNRQGKEIRVAAGGKGGRGNFNYRNIRSIEQGKEGETIEIELILKTLADVGLLGFPNSGKSTFLASVTRAFPKIAPYPFTTLRPHIGNWNFVDDRRMMIADLPGIIEDAHKNKGLGHEFLRHIERTKAILYIIDGTGEDERRPIYDYHILRKELGLYNKELLNYKSLIAVNKVDREHTNFKEKFDELQKVAHTEWIPISAKMSINIQDVILKLRCLVFNETEDQVKEKLSKYSN